MPAKPRAPAGLARRGRAFWTLILAVYELTDGELEVLAEVCRLLDEVEGLRAAVDGNVIVAGSTGQPRVHPAVAELRQHRLALGRLLAQLAVPDEDVGSVPSPASLRAQKAARSRWDRKIAERARRGTAAG